ncbi:GIY-YIG nuclease family protein [Nitrospira defluvii]|nr:GIY-YIG nuclease family protein [Nitrospira defluvii]
MAEFLTLEQVADLIGVEVTTVRRAVKRIQTESDIEIVKGKVPGRSKRALCVSDEHAKIITAYFHDKSTETALTSNLDRGNLYSANNYGYFYLIQLVPEVLPDRIKIGYTDNLENRLKEHQTSAPTAKLLKSWRCKRAWDQAAMDSITRSDCELVLNEVYEGEIEKFISRGNEFFNSMPVENTKIPISPNSPLNEKGSDL